jgi:MarR family transcriptional regulator, transcriptional regulator for hemolysin
LLWEREKPAKHRVRAIVGWPGCVQCRNSVLANPFPPETQFLHAAFVNRADMSREQRGELDFPLVRQAYHFKELHEMEVNSHTLGFLLHEVARLLKKRFEQHARGSGLTRSQWQVLTYLDRNEGINQSRLAGLLDLEPITLSRIVDKLQSFRLIERHPDPTDRRVWTLHLTPATRPKLTEVRKLGDLTSSEALAGVSDADRLHLLKTLQTLKSNLTDGRDTWVVEQRRAIHG